VRVCAWDSDKIELDLMSAHFFSEFYLCWHSVDEFVTRAWRVEDMLQPQHPVCGSGLVYI
jgi:hypothetical protein